ncbi:HPr kinase/phosphorylase [Salinarimonas ramus]|uniref:HPr kinase/phosphorylase C-terminal domain-containing protein n=1 Tax=Salinarimonas ramus TaxID=690164 RepID=A0A917Q767_9HYPH|nr:HPr kinase/phosphatase C-terminal domain-containing protein [Salinarimonas ramus]GGK32181.1 hypothetical protein GCM10011322_18550 [Salinarimonas ramus]
MTRHEATQDTIHATCVVVGEAGVLIRGASGAGKSRLALDLVEVARARGRFARLVGDDRLRLQASGGRLVARPHPSIAGLVEARGIGLLARPHLPAAIVRLVVDLSETPPERLPEPSAFETTILGVRLPRLPAAADGRIATIAMDSLEGLSVTPVT